MNAIYYVMFLIKRAVIIINVYLSTSRFLSVGESHGFYGDAPHGSFHLHVCWIWAWRLLSSTQPRSSTV